MDFGADDYLIKPFSMTELFNAIAIRFERQQNSINILDDKVNQILTQMGKSAAHEFNTPLNAIIGFSDLIISSLDDLSLDKVKKFVQWIHDSGIRLKTTLDKILLFQSLIADRQLYISQKENPEYYHINPSDIEAICKIIESKCKYDFIYKVEIQTSTIKIAYTYLKIILDELIDNAFKFADRDTTIEITGRCITPYKYELRVSNVGRGFNDNDIENIAPFTQFERNKYEQQGSGLGLFIVKQLCEIFEIQFHINSVRNLNTSVVLTFEI